MTAHRVVDDHGELEGIGTLTHLQIDQYITGLHFLSFQVPQVHCLRRLVG